MGDVAVGQPPCCHFVWQTRFTKVSLSGSRSCATSQAAFRVHIRDAVATQ